MKTEYRFAICVQNEGYPVSLELWKIYRIVPDKKAAQHHLVRVIDESGEDYLYDENSFVKIEVPESVERSILKQGAPPNGAEMSPPPLPELNIGAHDWIETDGLPKALAKKVNNSRAAIVFSAAGKENLIEADPAALVGQLRSQKFVVGCQNLSSFPGPPYFEALIALVPSGAVALAVLRDLILAWLQGRREREVEILMPSKASVRLKGAHATPKKALALISVLGERQKPKKISRQRTLNKAVKASNRQRTLER